MRQFGFPSIFITISPFEWTFPFPPWLEQLRTKTGKGPTELATYETIHIAHVIEQCIRGYLFGSNTNKWKNHVFAKKSDPSVSNVINYFYRFEFQKRGTLHTHILVWLDDINETDVNHFSATIPWGESDNGFLVYDLQKSRTSALPLRQAATSVLNKDGESYIAFHHTATDKSCNLQAYIPAFTASLKCSMDVQSSDRKSMLLKYVTSYVAKCHDVVKTQQLYSRDLGAYQAATSFLKNMHPLEPEMIMQLTSMKIAWTNSRTKAVTAPVPEQAPSKSYEKYLKRSVEDETLCYLEWLRIYDDSKSPPKAYKGGLTLVAVKHLSPFNPLYFYQLLAMHYAHRTQEQLLHPRDNTLPQPIKYFVVAQDKLPHILRSRDVLSTYLSAEAHKCSHFETLLHYVASLEDLVVMWQLGNIDSTFGSSSSCSFELEYPLSPQQLAVYSRFYTLLQQREEHFFGTGRTSQTSHRQRRQPRDTDYTKYQLLLGSPGTGKSQVIKRLIHKLLQEDYKVTLCAPLGVLATHYREEFYPNLQADTIHAFFNIPVSSEEEHVLNYRAGKYDCLIIDEASMVAEETFQIINDTLQQQVHRPLVIIAGDERQQPPLRTVDGRITQTTILANQSLRTVSQIHSLYQQFRCTDKSYLDFLQYIRYSEPAQYVLDNFQKPLLLFVKQQVSDFDIWDTIRNRPEATFLTVSRAAARRVNGIIIHRVFAEDPPLSSIPLEDETAPLFPRRKMRVVVTQNMDKRTGVVNGQPATIVNSYGNTLLLQFPNGHTTFTHPVTSTSEDNLSCVHYPLNAAYAMTICKTQGANIKELTVWFDSPVPRGMGYVALSRVQKSADIRLLTPVSNDQLQPACD